MTIELNDESSGAGAIQPDPVGDAHGADPEADPHVGKEMLGLISLSFFA